jgi:hypothetical protein
LFIRNAENHFFGVFKDFDFLKLIMEGFDLSMGLVFDLSVAHACNRK